MNADNSTPTAPEFQDPSINNALNSRIRYFKSVGGTMVLACFDSAPLEDNPYFLEIDRIEYEHLCKELES